MQPMIAVSHAEPRVPRGGQARIARVSSLALSLRGREKIGLHKVLVRREHVRAVPVGARCYSALVIGKRGAEELRSVFFRKENYFALLRAPRVLVSPISLILDEVFSRSLRTSIVDLRTPIGRAQVHLNGPVDLSTVFGVFCREDYHSDSQLKIAVDLGANIGIATLYFLTRNATSFVYAFEPVPANAETFIRNIAPHASRCDFSQVAVGSRSGKVRFGIEPTGKFGGINKTFDKQIDVTCVAINDVLDRVLTKHSEIDVLKIDVEGSEEEIIAAIAPVFWKRIRRIYSENSTSTSFMPDNFRRSYRYNVERLERL